MTTVKGKKKTKTAGLRLLCCNSQSDQQMAPEEPMSPALTDSLTGLRDVLFHLLPPALC